MDIKILQDDYHLIVFNKGDDLSDIYTIQEKTPRDKLIFVALDGTEDTTLYPDRFLVENYQTSMESHFLWNDLIFDEDRELYIIERAQKFIETGTQMYIEEYEFKNKEPFYDYTK